MVRLVILVVLFFACKSIIHSQNIENIVKNKAISVTGRIGTGTSYLADTRSDFDNRLGYNINIGVTANIYGVLSLPFSLTYSDQQTGFNRPTFKRFGISPNYKWITMHIGYRNYDISPYLISGSSIKGIGLELTPGSLLFKLFYGNLAHKFNIGYNDPDFSGNEIEYYKRKTIGGKIGFGRKSNYVHLSFFKATDKANTGDTLVLDSLNLAPKENFGTGFHAGTSIANLITLSTNIVGSIINEDQHAQAVDIDEGIESLSKNIMPINESTRYALAYDASLSFNIKRTQIGFKYQHIDPGYQSLGILYLQPDLDNYTFSLNTNMFNSKLSLYGNVGWQYDNTKEYLLKKDKRVIINGGINWAILQNLNLTANYNNFNSTNGVEVAEFRDSLRIVSNNVGLASDLSYSFGSKKSLNTLYFSISQNTFDIVQNDVMISNNKSSNYSLGYSKRMKSSGWTIGGNVRKSEFNDQTNNLVERYGTSLNIRKKIGKTANIALSPSYNLNYSNNERDGNVIAIKLRCGVRLNKKNSLNFTSSYKKRNTTKINPFSQMRFSLDYSTNF